MRRRLASRSIGFFPLLLLMGPSCSLVYDLSPDQCGTNADCLRLGDHLICDDGVCVGDPNVVQGGTGGKGGTSGKGGSGNSDMGGTGNATGGTIGEGGTSAEGGTGNASGGTGGGKGGSTGKGGTGGSSKGGTGASGESGSGPMAECTTHSDCKEIHPEAVDEPEACVAGECVVLRNDDCPILLPLGDNNFNTLYSTDAIVLGGFSDVASGHISIFTNNYDLAVNEINGEGINGIPVAGSSKRREVVMLLCDYVKDTQADLLPGARHLMEDLNIKGIIGTLFLRDQQYVWENVGAENGAFFMMPTYSDQALIDAQDGGLVWHMLADAESMSVTQQPLLDRAVEHLTNLGVINAEPTRVGLITSDGEAFLGKLRDHFDDNVTFNGMTAENNAATEYRSLLSKTTTQQDVIDAMLELKPHIIMMNTSVEALSSLIPGIEGGWDDAKERPLYLLSPLLFSSVGYDALVDADDLPGGSPGIPLIKRFVGMNWPSAEDPTVYNKYQQRYNQAYIDPAPGYENFYDAASYLIYAVAGAQQPLTGQSISEGMARLTNLASSKKFEVGPDDMNEVLNELKNSKTSTMEVIGAMGPPKWTSLGTRQAAASIYCIAQGPTAVTFPADVLRYDDSGSTPVLTGDFSTPCGFAFPEPP